MEIKKHFKDDDAVIIHDGNRPFVSNEIISNAISVYKKNGSAIVAIPCTEAVFKSKDGISSIEQISRDELFRTQTPHIYSLGKLLWAHSEAQKRGITNTTATCSLMQMLGEKIYFSLGSEENLKITTVDDIEIFEALLHTHRGEWIKNDV